MSNNAVLDKLSTFNTTTQTTSTSNSKKAIKDAVGEMVKSLHMIKTERDNIDAIADSLKEHHKIKTKTSKAAARRLFEADDEKAQALQAHITEIEALLEMLKS